MIHFTGGCTRFTILANLRTFRITKQKTPRTRRKGTDLNNNSTTTVFLYRGVVVLEYSLYFKNNGFLLTELLISCCFILN